MHAKGERLLRVARRYFELGVSAVPDSVSLMNRLGAFFVLQVHVPLINVSYGKAMLEQALRKDLPRDFCLELFKTAILQFSSVRLSGRKHGRRASW
jgi:hypothetical protein